MSVSISVSGLARGETQQVWLRAPVAQRWQSLQGKLRRLRRRAVEAGGGEAGGGRRGS